MAKLNCAETTISVWQGWWLGGWLQALLVVGPILFLFSQLAIRKMAASWLQILSLLVWRRKFFLALLVGLVVLVAYVVIARRVGLAETYEALKGIQDETIRRNILNAVDSLTYPIFVLLGVIIARSYFAYRAVSCWSAELVNLPTG
jgi:hypothetical protein